MEDDPNIDIEETSIMYPRIENIYSNATIKSEPLDYDDNEFASLEVAEYGAPEEYYVPYQNKIILGSKPSSTPVPGEDPATSMEDWRPEHYCEECRMGFETQNDLDTHKTGAHSFLVARSMPCSSASVSPSPISFTDSNSQDSVRSRRKAIKSTAKSSLLNNTFVSKISKIPYPEDRQDSRVADNAESGDNTDGLLCNHCDKRFPNEIALITHTYELLPDKDHKCNICSQCFPSDAALVSHRRNHYYHQMRAKDDEFLRCKFCSSYFKSEGGLSEHTLRKHKSTECDFSLVPFNPKCWQCNRSYSTYILYNKHLLKQHPKSVLSREVSKKGLPASTKYTCSLCKLSFPSKYSIHKHRVTKHPDIGGQRIFKSVAVNKIDPKAASSSKSKPSKPFSQTEQALMASKNDQGATIPKATLFKCNKCQIHFVTCSTALEHSKRCVLAKGDWKCNKCRRSFTLMERHVHMLQHDVSDKFKVLTVNEKLISKILCRCPKCEQHFDETTFWKHVSIGCVIEIGTDCSACSLKFQPNAYVKHRLYHTKYNYSKNDFITIDFVNMGTLKPVQNEPKTTDTTEEIVVPIERKYFLYYCAICKCYMKVLRHKMNHMKGRCLEAKRPNLCLNCGLSFTQKSMATHRPLCSDQVSLRDFEIRKIQGDKVIKPPMPDFYICNACEVRSMNKKSHICGKFSKRCSFCTRKYDSDAYKIHMSFHAYDSGAPKTKEEMQPDIYYSCIACDCVFDEYDSIVEHCQDHYYRESDPVDMNTCDVCELTYSGDHSHNYSSAFKVLKFDHEKLLTDEWLSEFDSMPKEQQNSIFTKSLYGVLRGVRLYLAKLGQDDRCIYKCAKCKRCFHPNDVVNHCMKVCPRSLGYNCTSCNETFLTKANRNDHVNLHVIYGDDIAFKHIIFNKPSDKTLNDALRATQNNTPDEDKKKEPLKFRKCPTCELFIKASEYDTHIASHETDEVWETGTTNGELGCKLLRPKDKKMYTVYQCAKCDACIITKWSVQLHNCSQVIKVQCKKCSLWFRGCSMNKHMEMHRQLPKFFRKNISIVKFIKDTVSTRTETRRKLTIETRSKAMENEKASEPPPSPEIVPKKTNPEKKIEDEPPEFEISPSVIKEQDEDYSNQLFDLLKRKSSVISFYQCTKCYRILFQKALLATHQVSCPATPLETPFSCDLCETTYHPSLLDFHKAMHEALGRFYWKGLVNLHRVISNGTSIQDENKWLFQCNQCSVNYLNRKSLGYHFSCNHKTLTDYVKCEPCGLNFTMHTLRKHVNNQHKRIKSKDDLHIDTVITRVVKPGEFRLTYEAAPAGAAENTKPASVSNEKTVVAGDAAKLDDRVKKEVIDKEDVVKENESVVKSVDRSVSKRKTVDSLIGKIGSDKKKESKSKAIDAKKNESPLKETADLQPTEPKKSTHILYKCAQCTMYYFSDHTLFNHMLVKKHKKNGVYCHLCGLCFGKGSLDRHIELHHVGGKKLPDLDIRVYKEFRETMAGLSEAAKVGGDPTSAPLGKEENVDNKAKIVLYQCQDCKVCLQKPQIKLHVCCSDIQKTRCLKCNLSFKRADMGGHGRLHKKHKNLTRKNFAVTKFGHRRTGCRKIYKCVSCSIHFMSLTALDWHMQALKHKTKPAECSTCGLMFGKYSLDRHTYLHHKKLQLSYKQLEVICVSNQKDTEPNRPDRAKLVSKSQNIRKLFKCTECDVYFLTQIAYYQHIYNHKMLDCTDFVACKICDLQFLNDALSIHMNSHRDKTFSLDKLLIEEYRPTSKSSRIESYLANTLNSVSTTTFDDEVDTGRRNSGDQLSTVDSTSDEVLKSGTAVKLEICSDNLEEYEHDGDNAGDDKSEKVIMTDANASRDVLQIFKDDEDSM